MPTSMLRKWWTNILALKKCQKSAVIDYIKFIYITDKMKAKCTEAVILNDELRNIVT